MNDEDKDNHLLLQGAFNEDDINIDEWVIIKKAGSISDYLGRVGDRPPQLNTDTREYRIARLKADVLRQLESGFIELNPCFDFASPVSRMVHPQTNQPAMTREPISLPVDFMCLYAPVYVPKAALYFLADLQGSDRSQYKSIIMQTVALMQASRANRAGIEVATSIPTGPTRRG